jgi:hypothetical protein
MKSIIFWDMTPCNPLSVNRCFGKTYRLHLEGRRNKEEIFSSETSVDTQRTSRWHIPEDDTFHFKIVAKSSMNDSVEATVIHVIAKRTTLHTRWIWGSHGLLMLVSYSAYSSTLVRPKRRTVSELHGFITQETLLLITHILLSSNPPWYKLSLHKISDRPA